MKKKIEPESQEKSNIPKTFAACADKLYKLKKDKAALKKKMQVIEDSEKEIKEHLINNLPKEDAEGAVGKLATATISQKVKPYIKDWEKLKAYIKKNKAVDLLEEKLSEKAVMARWEDGKKIPGIEEFTIISLKLNKR